MQSPSVSVPIGPCSCPGEPHPEGDVVQLWERLGLSGGVQLQAAIIAANKAKMTGPAITGLLGEQYLLVGVAGWNLVDEKGQPIPVSSDTIATHLLSDFERGTIAADKADELYAARYVVPLLQRAATSSRTTTTDASTSATKHGGARRQRTRSKPSSTSTTQTGVTATTSV